MNQLTTTQQDVYDSFAVIGREIADNYYAQHRRKMSMLFKQNKLSSRARRDDIPPAAMAVRLAAIYVRPRTGPQSARG